MKYLLRILCGLLLLPVWLPAQNSPISFRAEADARQVVLGGYFEVSFTLENAAGSDFEAPPFKDFKVLSGPNQSTSVSSINGKWSKTIAYSYVLQPKRVGTFTIGPASIRADGKVVKTKPVSISVLKAKDSNATTQDDIDREIKDEVFIQIEATHDEARIGEQIILDYKLYTTRDIETYNVVSESDYPGFYAQDIRQYNGRVIREVIEGVQYSTKILKRVALFPQQAGLLTVDPMVMQLAIIVDEPGSRRKRGFFYTPNITRLQVQTEAYRVNVLPLPEGAPDAFTGAVGNYQMTSSVNRTNLSTDDAISLTMTLSGTGDIKRVQPPELKLSDSLELYEPRVAGERSIEQRGELTGQKVFEYLILPQKPGTYTITPEFSYFDPDSLKYVVLSSDPYRFSVRKGTQARTFATSPAVSGVPEGDIRHIKTTTRLQQKGENFFGSPAYFSVIGLPLLLLCGMIGYRFWLTRRGEVDIVLLKRQRAEKIARKRMAQAEHHLRVQDSRAFYDEISKGLFGYVSDKLNMPLSELSKQNIREKLESLKVNTGLTDTFIGILGTCEKALFAGMSQPGDMENTYQSAMETLVKIEEEIGR